MRPLATLPLLCAMLSAAGAFEFTGPEGPSLNLSRPVEITWTKDGFSSQPEGSILDLWVQLAGSEDTLFGQQLHSNLSLSSSTSYTWDPSSLVDGLVEFGNKLSSESRHYFEAKVIYPGGSPWATIQSNKYSIVGVDDIISGAGAHLTPSGIVVGIAAGLALLNVLFL